MGHAASDQATPPKLTMKERAKKARHDAYVAAKERRKADPRTTELKARVKAARREVSAKAKELRKTDPKQIALKEKLKKDRREANEQRKTRTVEAKKTERARKDGDLRLSVGPMLELICGKLDGQTRTSLAAVRLTVIEGGKPQRKPT
jgi:hypothetical protein